MTSLLDQVLEKENLNLACVEVLRSIRKKKSRRYDDSSLVKRAKELRKKNTMLLLKNELGHAINCDMGKLRKAVLTGKYQRSDLYLHRERKPKGGFRYLMIHGALEDKIFERAVYQVIKEKLRQKLDNGISFCGVPVSTIDPKKLGLFVAHANISDILKVNQCWVLKADIEKFFDKLDRKIVSALLAQHLSDVSLINFFDQWLDIRIANIKKFPEYALTELGIPQGSCLSGLVANLYLLGFDLTHRTVDGAQMFRYADDLFFACESLQKAEEMKTSAEKYLSAIGLQCKEEKFEIASPGEKFEVLGYEYDLHKISIPKKRIAKWIVKLDDQFIRIRRVAYRLRNQTSRKDDLEILNDCQTKIWRSLRSYDANVRPAFMLDAINGKAAAKSARRMGKHIKASSKRINKILKKKFIELVEFKEDGEMLWPYVYPRIVGLPRN